MKGYFNLIALQALMSGVFDIRRKHHKEPPPLSVSKETHDYFTAVVQAEAAKRTAITYYFDNVGNCTTREPEAYVFKATDCTERQAHRKFKKWLGY
jgi:hypothetical protein